MKEKIGNYFNRIFAVIFCILLLSFVFCNRTNAVDKTEIETSIESTINEILKKYIASDSLDKDVEKVVDNAIIDFFNKLDKTVLEKELKDNIKSALQSNLYDIQTKFESVIEDITYKYTNEMLNPKVCEEIAKYMRSAISSHNASCYYEDDNGNRHLRPGAKLINSTDANNMITYVTRYVNDYIKVENNVSANIKNDTTEFIYLGDYVTDYLFTDEEKAESVKQNGGSITKVDRLKQYIQGNEVTNEVKRRINIDITNDIKEILRNSVNSYLENDFGKSIFNDIKTAVYYYIQENGGYDEVEKNGFSEDTIQYITDQILKIISGNIEYQVAPYVADISENVLKDVLNQMSHDYINNGVGQLIKDSVPYGVEERLKYSLSEILFENIDKYTEQYLKGLSNNQGLKDAINRTFSPYTSSDKATNILYNVGTRWEYDYDNDGDLVRTREIDSIALEYTKEEIWPVIRKAIVTEMTSYINGDKGKEISELARSNTEEVLHDYVLMPLLSEINEYVADWIWDGIVSEIWNGIKGKVTTFIKSIENDRETFEEETGIILGDIIKQVKGTGEPLYSKQISLEDLANSPYLVSAERGRILPPRVSAGHPLEDATLEVGVISLYEVPVYDSSKKIVWDPGFYSTNLINPWAPNPYGLTYWTEYGTFGVGGYPAGLSRTLARYTSKGIKNLEPEEAYVLAHNKNTNVYPDRVQTAYWKVLEDVRGIKYKKDEGIVDDKTYTTIMTLLTLVTSYQAIYDGLMKSISNIQWASHFTIDGIVEACKDWSSLKGLWAFGIETVQGIAQAALMLKSCVEVFLPEEDEVVEGKGYEDPIYGMELYAEATSLGTAIDNWNAFEKANGGKNLVDRTDYSKVEVSYSKDTDRILVGPFTIDYIREFYTPISLEHSEMYDKDTEIISYTGIIDAKLYVDDAKTIEINDWKFVYPDKRNCLPAYDQKYKYPYPNEVFYLEFPSMENYSINTLSKMRFQLEKMEADGQTYQLSGGYDQLLWISVDVPIPCLLPPVRCIHATPGGHPIGLEGYCWPKCCYFHRDPTWTPYMYHHAWNGHLMGHQYFCTQVKLGSNLHAMNLEQVIYSKIYKEYYYVDIELGEVKPYYVTSVNTTKNMEPSEKKGNLTIQTSEVPILPFLPNYDGYPGYPNYPQYTGNPNYPDNPYTFNNAEYSDYASWPYYTGKGPNGAADPTYPYYAEDEVIPLTFHISGTVWLDNPGGTEAEANGLIDSNERGIPNVEVVLYKKGDTDYIAKTLTNKDGYYIFEYVRVGFDYHVEFIYDGMTYRSTEYLQSNYSEGSNSSMNIEKEKYIRNPDEYLTSSHAVENIAERDAFNDKFYCISENLATAKDGSTIELEYKTWQTNNGAVSTLITVDDREITKDEFKISARTKETSLYFPLHNKYQVDNVDLNLYKDGTQIYTKTYPGLEHINLGLIKREQGDVNVKTDLYQVITTQKLESGQGDIQKYKYDGKSVDADTFDILFRENGYYTNIPYHQELNPDDVAYRYDSSELYGENTEFVSTILGKKDELDVYVEYKILIKNQSKLEKLKLVEIENSFDSDLEYLTKYDWTDMASWIEVSMNEVGQIDREEIIWEYRDGMDNGYFTIFTDDLKDRELAPQEMIEIHLILKVKKDENRTLKMDLDSNDVKRNVTEVTKFSYSEGKVDQTSNPGSARLGNARTYADGTDTAPLLKMIYEVGYNVLDSNSIEGYVWDDLVKNIVTANNQFIGNGLIDKGETKINGVKVELIEVIRNKETGEEIEVLRKTPSGTDFYRTGEDIVVDGQTIDIKDGEYRFLKLEAGTYRVKFTYGDEVQLTQDLKYNAQDYKTLSLDTIYQQYNNPKLEVMLLLDTSENMKTDNKLELMRNSITPLVDNLYKNVQKVKIGGYLFSEPAGGVQPKVGLTEKPSVENLLETLNIKGTSIGMTLSDTIEDALTKFSRDADEKVIVIMTDGYMKQAKKDKEALKKAEEKGVKVITVAASMDEWDDSTFGTEENPTTGILYNIKHGNCEQYISEVVLEDILLEFEDVLPNLTDAKDVEYSYTYYINGEPYNDIYSRKRNIDYSDVMINENAEVLHLENIMNVSEETPEIKAEKISTLAENTKVTAITPNKNITFLHDKTKTKNTNMGLVERPKVEFRIQEEIYNTRIKLANGEVIIDTLKGLSQNVQEFDKQQYVYMDEEIMRGATIEIQYKITVTNNGLVDTLADYFTYDMFDEQETFNATTTVANKIGTIYNYYTNEVFREEENNNIEIEVNDVKLRDLQFDNTKLKNWKKLLVSRGSITPKIKEITTRLQENGMPVLLKQKARWNSRESIKLKESVDKYIDRDEIKIVETRTLRNIPIYPNISKEALSQKGVSSISFYINYSKVFATLNNPDSLVYKNSAEIVERLNQVGRRDYQIVTGNYQPHNREVIEYDSTVAKDIIILQPFGANRNYVLYIVIILSSALILTGGIIFIRKKVL